MRVECNHDRMVDPRALKDSPFNNNRHSQQQIEALAKIIQNVGFRSPIVVSNRSGYIVKGHGRKLAAIFLGLTEVPVDFQDYESEVQELQDLTADNRIASYAEFDLPSFDEALKDLGLNFNEIDLEEFGILDVNVDFDETPKEESKDKDEPEEKLQIVIKCADQDELECLTFEFQSKGLSFEVKR